MNRGTFLRRLLFLPAGIAAVAKASPEPCECGNKDGLAVTWKPPATWKSPGEHAVRQEWHDDDGRLVNLLLANQYGPTVEINVCRNHKP